MSNPTFNLRDLIGFLIVMVALRSNPLLTIVGLVIIAAQEGKSDDTR